MARFSFIFLIIVNIKGVDFCTSLINDNHSGVRIIHYYWLSITNNYLVKFNLINKCNIFFSYLKYQQLLVLFHLHLLKLFGVGFIQNEYKIWASHNLDTLNQHKIELVEFNLYNLSSCIWYNIWQSILDLVHAKVRYYVLLVCDMKLTYCSNIYAVLWVGKLGWVGIEC